MKKIINSFVAGVFLLGVATPKLSFFWDKKEEKVQERVEQEIQSSNPGIGAQENTKERERNFVGTRAAIGLGKVISIDETNIVITANENTYTVQTDTKTQFRRNYWGKSSLDEIAVGSSIRVIGKWQDQERTRIRAVIVRNLSLQKRYGVFFGVVTEMGEGSFKIQSVQRGEVQVLISAETYLVNRLMEDINFSDIEVGHRVRIKGTWDETNSILEGVTQIKDFSIPLIEVIPEE